MNMIIGYSKPQSTQAAMPGHPAEYAVDYMLNVVADHNLITFTYKIYLLGLP